MTDLEEQILLSDLFKRNTAGIHTWYAAIKNLNTIDERKSKSLETDILIAICRLTGDKWQSKLLFLVIFAPISSIV